jgi:hypothetical protein
MVLQSLVQSLGAILERGVLKPPGPGLVDDLQQELSGIASAGRETADQQVASLAERRSGRPDASPVTWEDPVAIPSDE